MVGLSWSQPLSHPPTQHPLSMGRGGLTASAAHASCSASSSRRLAAGSGPGTDQGWPLGEGGGWLRRTGAGAAGGAGLGACELLDLATPACLSSFGTTSEREHQCRSPTCLTCCQQRGRLSQHSCFDVYSHATMCQAILDLQSNMSTCCALCTAFQEEQSLCQEECWRTGLSGLPPMPESHLNARCAAICKRIHLFCREWHQPANRLKRTLWLSRPTALQHCNRQLFALTGPYTATCLSPHHLLPQLLHHSGHCLR